MAIKLGGKYGLEKIYKAFENLRGVVISTRSDEKLTRLYTTKLPPIRLGVGKNERELEVVLSSKEIEDNVLLHKLLQSTKKS